MHRVTRLIHRITPRHALRRVLGLMLFALFARQTTATTWMTCSVTHENAGTMAPMTAPAMAHHHMPAAPTAPSAPRHSTDCNGTAPAGCCVVGGSCVSLLVLPALSFAPAVSVQPLVDGGQFDVPPSRDVAPADPPPRA